MYMKENFKFDKIDALAKALGGRIDLLEKLIKKDGLSGDMIQTIVNSKFRQDFIHIYGFHIDSNESDPYACVTYLEDAKGKTPAHMNYSTGKFEYGGWEDAFFMPRPCMLKFDGTVDYYLDPNDYSKKEDGTASDVADFAYDGNAMMEWGKDGEKIWYKVVPDRDDNTSADIFFSNYQIDEGYHAWSFINNQGNMVDHFYTPIYNGTLDGDGKLRSISGKANTDLCQSKTAAQEITAAELNNPGKDKLWYTEVFSDITLINLLLVLMGKSLNTQDVFGNGACKTRDDNAYTASDIIGTGTADDKGLFFGSNDMVTAVKVFGMENYWGNQYRRYAGLISVNGAIKYKMTYGTNDGSEAESYNTTAEDYLASDSVYTSNTYGWSSKNLFSEDGSMFTRDSHATDHTGYCDYNLINVTGAKYACRGGGCGDGLSCGAFYVGLAVAASGASWNVGASLSCKPLE